MFQVTTEWHVQVVEDAVYVSEICYRYYLMFVEGISGLYGEWTVESEGNLLADSLTC